MLSHLSQATLNAISEGAIQVLTSSGLDGCTTTRIAERAGVSVGTLYQYYPNRDAVLATVLKKHLNQVCRDIERDASLIRRRSTAEVARRLPQIVVAAKFSAPDLAFHLYDFTQLNGGERLVEDATNRLRHSITSLLNANETARIDDPKTTASVLLGAYAGNIQAYLKSTSLHQDKEGLLEHLEIMTTGYLEALSSRRAGAMQRTHPIATPPRTERN